MGKQTTTCNRTHSVASRRRRNELDNVINKHEFPVGITSENRGNKEVSHFFPRVFILLSFLIVACTSPVSMLVNVLYTRRLAGSN